MMLVPLTRRDLRPPAGLRTPATRSPRMPHQPGSVPAAGADGPDSLPPWPECQLPEPTERALPTFKIRVTSQSPSRSEKRGWLTRGRTPPAVPTEPCPCSCRRGLPATLGVRSQKGAGRCRGGGRGRATQAPGQQLPQPFTCPQSPQTPRAGQRSGAGPPPHCGVREEGQGRPGVPFPSARATPITASTGAGRVLAPGLVCRERD